MSAVCTTATPTYEPAAASRRRCRPALHDRRPSFITGPDRDEARPIERAGAAVTGATLGLLDLFGASRLRARYRSTSNTVLAAALVRVAADPRAENSVRSAEDLHNGSCPKGQ